MDVSEGGKEQKFVRVRGENIGNLNTFGISGRSLFFSLGVGLVFVSK